MPMKYCVDVTTMENIIEGPTTKNKFLFETSYHKIKQYRTEINHA